VNNDRMSTATKATNSALTKDYLYQYQFLLFPHFRHGSALSPSCLFRTLMIWWAAGLLTPRPPIPIPVMHVPCSSDHHRVSLRHVHRNIPQTLTIRQAGPQTPIRIRIIRVLGFITMVKLLSLPRP